MIVGGVDVGSATGKAVVMKDGEIIGSDMIAATTRPQETARLVMEAAIRQAGLPSIDHLDHIIGTGYGRLKVPFAEENVSEISCHARGAHWLAPTTRTVVDIGGQDCKVISVSDKGTVLNFAMNDRCAAGTGRFFEAMARVLYCGLEGLSALENQGLWRIRARNPASSAISAACSRSRRSSLSSMKAPIFPTSSLGSTSRWRRD
jgi:predicted CoA-substrate-specific enzyme activase